MKRKTSKTVRTTDERHRLVARVEALERKVQRYEEYRQLVADQYRAEDAWNAIHAKGRAMLCEQHPARQATDMMTYNIAWPLAVSTTDGTGTWI